MRTFERRFILRGLVVVGTLLALCASAQAQRWENLYGGATTEETARNGVRPVAEGGYVAVGSSRDPTTLLDDIYVVRTDNQGGLAWSRTYDIGRNDTATDIEEIRNAMGMTTGFIITGYTNHRTGASCGASFDIFLLQIDRCGNVVWVNTYGMMTADEYGWDVIITTLGNGSTTFPGDYVVAGWQGNTPFRDGYLLRVNAAGAPVWGMLYSGFQNNRDDYFYSLDESTFGSGAGDIIAAGGTTSYRVTANLDAWEVRADGNTGAVVNASAFGSATTDEDLKSVRELNSGSDRGQIVAVGQTTTGTNTDIYVLQSAPTLFPINDRMLGFCDPDEAYYVRELASPADTIPSTIIVTGHVLPLPGWGLGGQDAFLQEFQTGSLALVGDMYVYGNPNNDRGWSVEPVQANPNCVTQGFIVAGYVRQPTIAPADPQQLYMFKTNAAKTTGCERSFMPPILNPPYDYIPEHPRATRFEPSCTPPIDHVVRNWIQNLCPLSADGTIFCSVPACEDAGPAPEPSPDLGDLDRPLMRGDAVMHAR